MGPKTVWLLSNPVDVQLVLHDQAKKFVKGYGYDILEIFLGRGLLTSDGSFWHRQRRLIQPVFHRSNLVGFAQVMQDEADALVLRLRGQVEVDVTTTMLKLTMEIVGKTLFGTNVSDHTSEVSPIISELIEDANRRLLSVVPLPVSVPLPRNLRTRRLIERLDGLMSKMIEERRNQKENDPKDKGIDLLSLLIAATDDQTNERMTDRQLRDEAMTIFVAGHETTANALAWTLILLAQHPEVQTRAREEVQKPNAAPGLFERVLSYEYLGRVIDESMRMYPPAWVVSRQSTEPVALSQTVVHPDEIVAISSWVLHRDPDFWKDPQTFDPERFTADECAKRHKYSYIPFGAGPRQCIGTQFARVELLTVLSTLLRNYRFELSGGSQQKIEPHPLVTLRPRGRVPMKFIPI